MNLIFKNTEDSTIEQCFAKVLRRYTSLHQYQMILEQKRIKGSTMQAQPVIGWRSLLGGTKKYRVKLAVYVRDSEEIKVSELPEDVLIGWFAHELGHVVDYASYSSLGMIRYGFLYLVSENFKKKVEYEADYIAIKNGFRKEIVATKKFILGHKMLGDEYKQKIEKYYMPIELAETWEHKAVPYIPTLASVSSE